jgi:hypothetical protein
MLGCQGQGREKWIHPQQSIVKRLKIRWKKRARIAQLSLSGALSCYSRSNHTCTFEKPTRLHHQQKLMNKRFLRWIYTVNWANNPAGEILCLRAHALVPWTLLLDTNQSCGPPHKSMCPSGQNLLSHQPTAHYLSFSVRARLAIELPKAPTPPGK